MNKKKVLGRVLYVDRSQVWLANGTRLYRSFDSGEVFELVYEIKFFCIFGFLVSNDVFSRLFRLGYHHLVMLDNDRVIIFFNRNILVLNVLNKSVVNVGRVCGKRPLAVAFKHNLLVYGEYFDNKSRKKVVLWGFDTNDFIPKVMCEFEGIRHIHGVYYDIYSDTFWITTGDDDSESGIWQSSLDFKNIRKVVYGHQLARAVDLIFTEKYVYYGTDSPNIQNRIRIIDRVTNSVEDVCTVSGPVFYGCKISETIYFSTVVEPSTFNYTNSSNVYAINGMNHRVIGGFFKDRYDKRLFQYGQIRFPRGPGDEKHLWITPLATESSGVSYRLPISL